MSAFVDVAFALVGDDLLVTAANPAFAGLVGRPLQDIVGQSGRQWTNPEDMPQCLNAFERAFSQQTTVTMLRRVVHPDGSILLARADLFPLQTANKRIVLASNRVLKMEKLVENQRAFDVSDYIEDMAESLASMAADVGLSSLQEALSGIASDASVMLRSLDEHR